MQVDAETFKTLPRHELSLVGNLGKDLELRKTPQGVDVASTTLAVNTQSEGGEGSTTWWKLNFWGEGALSASAAISKGTRVAVKGPVVVNSYTTSAGEFREASQLVITSSINLLRGSINLLRGSESQRASEDSQWNHLSCHQSPCHQSPSQSLDRLRDSGSERDIQSGWQPPSSMLSSMLMFLDFSLFLSIDL